jgi:uncharacterized membrane protein YkoI
MRQHLLSATILSLLVAGPAWAADTAAPRAPQSTAMPQAQTPGQQASMMSERDLEKHLNQQGFTSVGMIKLMGDTYEARAYKSGKSVALEVDARTGKILAEDPAPRD